MDTLAKADIFFFVTTIAVVIIGILLAIVLTYSIFILKDMKALSKRAKEEGERIMDDIESLRLGSLSKGAYFLGKAYSFLGLGKKSKSNRKKEE